MVPVPPCKRVIEDPQLRNNSMKRIHFPRYIEGKNQAISEAIFLVFDLILALPLFSMADYEHNMEAIAGYPSFWKHFLLYSEMLLLISLRLVKNKKLT